MSTIAINGRFLDTRLTGVQRYALEIVRSIDQLMGENHPAIAGFTIKLLRPDKGQPPAPYAHIEEVRAGNIGGHFWEQTTLPRMARGSLLLNLCNLSPLAHRRSILCVHDAHVWLTPENYSRPFRSYYRTMLPLMIRRSVAWTTVSNYSEAQLRRYHVADRPAAAVIGNGADSMAAINTADASLSIDSLPKRYVLAVGSRARNKNVALLTAIAPELSAMGLSVVVAGDANKSIFSGESEKSPSNVVALGRVSDADLALLYDNAVCFAFPSFFEGFGIPPVEAMARGCPVVASNSSALPGVLGDAAIFCDPAMPFQWVEAIKLLSTDDALTQTMRDRGFQQANRYSWASSALAYAELSRRYSL